MIGTTLPAINTVIQPVSTTIQTTYNAIKHI